MNIKHCLIILLPMAISNSALADEFAEAVKKGKKVYSGSLCLVCHGPDGKGEYPEWMRESNFEGKMDKWGRMAPDLNNSKILQDPERTAVVLLKGIEWDPNRYELPMWYWFTKDQDQEVAEMVTFLRSEFGGFRELTTAAQVAKWREKHAKIPVIGGAKPGPENIVGGVPREQLEKINAVGEEKPGSKASTGTSPGAEESSESAE